MQSQGWELFLFKIRPFTVLHSQGLWPFPSVPLPWALPHFGFPLEILMDHPGMSPTWLSVSAPWIPRQVIAVHETAFDFPNKKNSICQLDEVVLLLGPSDCAVFLWAPGICCACSTWGWRRFSNGWKIFLFMPSFCAIWGIKVQILLLTVTVISKRAIKHYWHLNIFLPPSWGIVIYIKLTFLFFLPFFERKLPFLMFLLFRAQPYMAFFYDVLGGMKYSLAYMHLL